MDDIFSQKVSASVGLGGKKIVEYMAELKKSGFALVCRCITRMLASLTFRMEKNEYFPFL